MPLSEADAIIAAAIMAAPDKEVVRVEEDITEPLGVTNAMKRTVSETWSSPTVEVGKSYKTIFDYINPPSSKAWGAISGTTEEILQ